MIRSELQSSPYQSTYLALRDRQTGSLRLVEANLATVGAEVDPPQSTNPLLLRDPASSAQDEEAPSASAAMKRHLVKQFGQAKGQRMYEQQETNKVETDAISSESP